MMRQVSARGPWALSWLAPAVLSASTGVNGCCKPRDPVPWGKLTADRNRTFQLPGRPREFMVYRDEGPRNAPLTFLFVHGAGSSKIDFKYVAEHFQGRYRQVLIDLPGHGDSTLCPRYAEFDGDDDNRPRGLYTLEPQADVVNQFIHSPQLGNPHDLVLFGLSYGGGVVLEAYRRMTPDERSAVRGLVLVAPAADYFPKPEQYDNVKGTVRFPLSDTLALLIPSCVLSDSAWEAVLYDSAKVPEKRMRELRAELDRVLDRPGDRHIAPRVALNTWRELRWRKLHDDNPRRYACVTCPVLIIWGEYDSVIYPTPVIRALQRTIRDCEVHVLDNAGHNVLVEKQDAVIELMDKFAARLTNQPRRGRNGRRGRRRVAPPADNDDAVIRPLPTGAGPAPRKGRYNRFGSSLQVFGI